ncbi:MAG: dockerin type I repeat-containing protein [Candidatus Sumerlaeota bacterium]|nr:dockerin type I repeat-containing protein [Candidatus Sumerlaeota bacterium]
MRERFRPAFFLYLAALLMVATVCPALAQLPGDVTGDGTISLADSGMICDHILGRSTLTGDALLRADANQDGVVDAADVVQVQRSFSPPVRQPNSVFVDETSGLSAVDFTSPTLTLQWTGGGAPPVHAGDIVFGTGAGGFLRRVISIDVNGPRLTLDTGDAVFAEAYASGSFMTTVVIGEGGPSRLRAPEPGRLVAREANLGRWDLTGKILYQDSYVTIDVPSGLIALNADMDLDFTLEDFQVRYARLVAEGSLTADLEVRARANAERHWSGRRDIPGLSDRAFVPLGYGLFLEIDLQAITALEIDFDGSAEATTGLRAELPVRLGGEYDRGEWRRIGEAPMTIEAIQPAYSGSANLRVRATVAPEGSLLVEGAVGGAFSLEPYLLFTGNAAIGATPWSYVLDGGLDASLAVDFGWLDWLIPPKEFGRWNLWQKELLRGPEGPPSGPTRFMKTFGGANFDYGNSVQQTTDGGYVLAGWTQSYGAGGDDAWLIKTDAAGNKQWDRTFGGASGDWAASVQQTADGGYVLAGYTDSYGAGGGDAWLIKTDATGNKQWDRTFGGALHDWADSVQQTADGGYVLAGGTDSYGVGGGDVWLIKTDEYGNKEWDRTFGGANYDGAGSVQQTSDGGYVIAGGTQSYGVGGGDAWLIKTDEDGNEEWDHTSGGVDWDWANSVQQTSDGGYVYAGCMRTSGPGYADVWLVKTDAAGNRVWDRTFFSGADYEAASSVRQTADGGYVMTGTTTPGGYSDDDAFLIKTDAEGRAE